MKSVARGAGAVVKSPVGFARGLSYALRGMRFVYVQHPKLARYWVFPILITGLALVAVFYGAGSYYDDLGGALWSLFPESWNEATGWAGGLLRALRWLIELIAGILITLFGLVLVLVLSSVVAAPFNDALSEAVEIILTGEPAPTFSFSRMLADIVRTIRLELLKVLVYLAVVGPMFIAAFVIPGVGQVISLVGFALTAAYLGIDYVDWPAAPPKLVGKGQGGLCPPPATCRGGLRHRGVGTSFHPAGELVFHAGGSGWGDHAVCGVARRWRWRWHWH